MTTDGYTLLMRYRDARSLKRWLVFEFWLYIGIALTAMVIAEYVDEEGWDVMYVCVVALMLFLAGLSAVSHHHQALEMERLQQQMAQLSMRRRAATEQQLRITREQQRREHGQHDA